METEIFANVVGCLVLGAPSTYDGSNCAPTRTVFVCTSQASYLALQGQGAMPIALETVREIWQEPLGASMTQFEWH